MTHISATVDGIGFHFCFRFFSVFASILKFTSIPASVFFHSEFHFHSCFRFFSILKFTSIPASILFPFSNSFLFLLPFFLHSQIHFCSPFFHSEFNFCSCFHSLSILQFISVPASILKFISVPDSILKFTFSCFHYRRLLCMLPLSFNYQVHICSWFDCLYILNFISCSFPF